VYQSDGAFVSLTAGVTPLSQAFYAASTTVSKACAALPVVAFNGIPLALSPYGS
jgi:hypothetical protein